MLLTRLHKLAWLNITLRLLVVVGLLLPRVAWGECRCEGGCIPGVEKEVTTAATNLPAAAPAKTPAKKACCCGDSSAPCCCCCSAEDKTDSEQGDTNPHVKSAAPSQPQKPSDHDRQPVKNSAPANQNGPVAVCVMAPEDCGCNQIEVSWGSTATLSAKPVELDSPACLLPTVSSVISPVVPAGAALAPRPDPSPGSESLQPRLCRWQV